MSPLRGEPIKGVEAAARLAVARRHAGESAFRLTNLSTHASIHPSIDPSIHLSTDLSIGMWVGRRAGRIDGYADGSVLKVGRGPIGEMDR